VASALAFDMYGTLVDPARWAGALAGQVAEPERFAGVWRRHQLEISWLLSLMGRYEDWRAVTGYAFDAALAETGQAAIGGREELLERVDDDPRLFDDTAEALARLQRDGHRLAVLSNGTPRQLHAILERTGIAERFAEVVSVDEVGVFKPSPAVYEHSARRLGLPPGQVWLVSGNPFDVAGAKAAGLHAVRVERGPALRYGFVEPPDLVVSSLAELADTFPELSRPG
jgi:2-haloacid dehalogenase